MSGGSDWMLVLTDLQSCDLVWEYWPEKRAWHTGSVSPTEGRWRLFCGDLCYNFCQNPKDSKVSKSSEALTHHTNCSLIKQRIFIQGTVVHLRAIRLRKHKEKTSSCAINLLSLNNWQLHKSNTGRILAWRHSNFSKGVFICHQFLMLWMNLTFLVTFWLPFPRRGLLYPIALTS